METNHVTYNLIEGFFTVEQKTHKGCGISVTESKSDDKICFNDISTNKEAVVNLISLCNELQLAPIHIKDVIEDFLS